jgi:hypothetical protein
MVLSRKDTATITWSEWVPDGDVFWLTVRTGITGERAFRVLGSDKENLNANQRSGWAARFTLGNMIAIGDLHTVPVISAEVDASILSGVFFNLGYIDDGLADMCGPLAFARIEDYNCSIYEAGDRERATLERALNALLAAGTSAAREEFARAGYATFVAPSPCGPAWGDPCVREVNARRA